MKGKKDEIKIVTIIGNGSECNGEFSSEGSVRIDGVINGDVNVANTLILGATGNVNGNVTARTVIIGGEVVGNINAPDKTELTETARVLGDIRTNIIVIDEKAVFQGKCDMNQETLDKRARLSGKAMRAGKKTAKAAIAEALKEVAEANREDGTEGSASYAEDEDSSEQ